MITALNSSLSQILIYYKYFPTTKPIKNEKEAIKKAIKTLNHASCTRAILFFFTTLNLLYDVLFPPIF